MKLINDTDVLLDAFGLTKTFNSTYVNQWINTTDILTDLQQLLLNDIHQKSFQRISGWNEEEVKMKMISFLFYIANLEEDGKINTFFEREMIADIDGKHLSVVCDCLIATPLGLSSPRFPYFFLQEFKRRKKGANDPEGQMLAAMLIAQYKNQDNKPVYGAWLTGTIWEFAILEGKNLHASITFDSTKPHDLLQIVFILRKLKELILNR
jgi:hypothetical protein